MTPFDPCDCGLGAACFARRVDDPRLCRPEYRRHVLLLSRPGRVVAAVVAPPVAPRPPPCVHLGEPLREPDGTRATRACPTCAGLVRLKLWACGHPGHAADPTTTEPGCRACPDYAAGS